jgi:esterase/lipase superfamily enzyme
VITRRLLGLLSALWLALLAASPATAAFLRGQAVGPQGEPLAGVLVIATHGATRFGGVSRTDGQGRFRIDDLPAGEYQLAGERAGYRMAPLTLSLDEATASAPLVLRLVRSAGFQSGADAAPKPRNYATVEVFWGTDRQAAGTGAFGPRRGEPRVGRSTVSMPRRHRMGELESASLWRLEFRPDPARHVAVLRTVSEAEGAWLAALARQVAASKAKSVFVFVHGFNVGFDDAARRTAQLAYDLGFEGAPVFYSWPSNGSVVDYIGDGDNAAWSVPHLVRFLELVAQHSGATAVHLIAHSMGSRVLTAALGELVKPAAAPGGRAGARFEQLALVAPDIDAEVFRRDIAPRLMPAASRITLYASSHDRALLLARKIRAGYARAGDLSHGPVLVAGIDTVDVSAVDTSLVGHSYFGDSTSVLADLFYLLRDGLAPDRRARLQPIEVATGRYWRFAP